MATIPFSQFIEDNSATLKSFMSWQNYDLNDTVLPVVNAVQDDSLTVLKNYYNKFHVEQDILPEFSADVFIHFPVLLQQLSISRVLVAKAVLPIETLTDTLTRTENLKRETTDNSNLTLGTGSVDTNELNTERLTSGTSIDTGTSEVDNTTSASQNTDNSITNNSAVDRTGNRTVNLSNNMPEQALDGTTGNFPVDEEGTPILGTAYAQSATQGFTTANPVTSTESSNQESISNSNGTNNTKTTNDLTNTQNVTVSDSGDTKRTITNNGTDQRADTGTLEDEKTTVETRNAQETNKQYAYEIKAFLETSQSINAFQNWVNNFSWVSGII